MVTAAVRAYDQLRADILRGVFQEGSHLSEDRLARLLGCSRTPVREALRRLSAEGLVELLPHRGARVVDWSQENLEEVFRLRAMLESYGASLAAQAMEREDVAHLYKLVDRMEEVAGEVGESNRAELAQLDVEFHHRVLVGGGSRRLLEAHARVVQVPLHHRVMREYTADQLSQRMRHHRELAHAIELGDPDWAAAVMRSHILSALNILLTGD